MLVFNSTAYDVSELKVKLEMMLNIKEAFDTIQTFLKDVVENNEEKVRAAFENSLFATQGRVKMYIR